MSLIHMSRMHTSVYIRALCIIYKSQTSRRNVCGHQNRTLPALELLQHPVSFALLLVAVDR